MIEEKVYSSPTTWSYPAPKNNGTKVLAMPIIPKQQANPIKKIKLKDASIFS